MKLGQYIRAGPDIYPFPVNEDRTVSFLEVISDSVTLVKVFKGLDSPSTRYEAQELSRFSDMLHHIGVKLIGIIFDVAGSEDFVNSGCWKGEFYLDPKRSVYRYLGLFKRTPLLSRSNLLRREERENDLVSRPDKSHLLQLGGTYIMKDTRIVYKYEQTTPIALPNNNIIFKICQSQTLTKNHLYTSDSILPTRPATSDNPTSLLSNYKKDHSITHQLLLSKDKLPLPIKFNNYQFHPALHKPCTSILVKAKLLY